MSRRLLAEYEIWKRRQTTWPPSDIKGYFADGIEIGEKLLRVGCSTDRDGLDIREQVEILKEHLRKMGTPGNRAE